MQWKQWIGIILSLAFLGYLLLNHEPGVLWWALRRGDLSGIWNPDLHLSELRDAFLGAHYLLLAVAVLVSLLVFVVRAWRWGYLLRPLRPIPLISLYSATMVGFMAINVLPARVGEVVRAYVLARRERLALSGVLGSLVAERLFDSFTLLSLFLLTSALHPFPGWVGRVGVWSAAVFAAFLGMVVLMVVWPRRFMALVLLGERLLPRRWRQRAEGLVASFLEGLRIFRKPGLILRALILSWAHWLLLGWGMAVGLRAFGVDLPPVGPYFLLSIVCIGIAIPASPGFVGTFEGFTIAGLALFGVERSLALGFALGFHAVPYFPTVLVGLLFLIRENLTWGQIRRMGSEVPREEVAVGP